ncbi:MAG: hypothetical protein CMM93_05065 [Rickettsiales bacterium]|nr:hypothetical protein [Rickettsiales bacterium]|tara:strand:- start:249 stop:1475 length:1227 start_codon:yes stop_codon:yes gene_type:complete
MTWNTRLETLAFWLLLLVPLTAPVSRFASDVCLIFVAIFFLIHSIFTRDLAWLRHRWVQIALALWAYLVVRAVFTEEMVESVGRAASWLRFPIFAAAMAYWLLRDERRHRTLLYSLSIALGFMILDTFMQYLLGFDILGRAPIPNEGSPRLTGPFTSPRVGIMIIWLAVPAMAWWLMQPGRKSLLLGVLFTAGSALVIFLSGERMAFLLTGLAFILAFAILPASRIKMAGIGALTALLLSIAVWHNPGLMERQGQQTSEVVGEISGSIYGQIWQSGIEISKEHLWIGVGLRQFRVYCPDAAYGPVNNIEMRCNLHPHNMYLEWLVEAGLIGLIGFVGIVLCWLRPIPARFAELRRDPLCVGLLITLVIRLWPLASTTSFFTSWSAVPFWLMAGWWLAVLQPSYAKGQS